MQKKLSCYRADNCASGGRYQQELVKRRERSGILPVLKSAGTPGIDFAMSSALKKKRRCAGERERTSKRNRRDDEKEVL